MLENNRVVVKLKDVPDKLFIEVKTIKNLGIIASKGMEDTDKIILDIMLCK